MPDSHSAAIGRAVLLADALRPVVLRLSRHLRREAQRFGVSALDAQLLAIIKKRRGIGVSALAQHEQITKPAMSAHIRRLEDAGWVARDEEGHADRRRVGLVITKAGQRALDDIRKQRNDWLAERLDGLTGAELVALEAALAPLNRLSEDAP